MGSVPRRESDGIGYHYSSMWDLALLALGQTAGPLLKRAAERHVERFFGDRLGELARLGKKDAAVTAMERAWTACVDLILREVRYLGDYEDADPDFRAFFGPLRAYLGQDVVGSELLRPLLALDEEAPDPTVLAFGWNYLEAAPDLPEGFSWARIAERYRKSLTTERILSPDLRDQLAGQNLERIHRLLEGHAGVQPEADEARYAERMREKYRVLDLSAMLPPTADERGEMLLRHAFVPQNLRYDPPPVELPRDLLRRLVADGAQPEEATDEHTARQLEMLQQSGSHPVEPLLEAVAAPANRKLVLLGGPGSGKSTLTRYLLLTTLDPPRGEAPPGSRTFPRRGTNGTFPRRGTDGTFRDHLPLLVELRDFIAVYGDRRCDNFLDYWHHLGKTQKYHLDQGWLDRRLRSSPSLVLFDGLDEIFDARQREQVMHTIAGFAGEYPRARVVVTSRPVGYRDAILRAADFRHYAVEDLDDEQIETFVTGWFGHLFADRPREAEQRRQRILGAAAASRPVRLLAGNPMLLTIMALIAQLRELPRERWRFYDHAAEVLCHHWDVNRHLEAEGVDDFIGLEDKKELLERIAGHMQQGEGGLAGNVIREQELRAEVEGYLERRYDLGAARVKPVARRLIAQLRERNYVLCLRGPRLYGFVHRTFLEYFSATGVVRRLRDDPEYTVEHLRDEVFAVRWQEESWREVLRLIAGMVGDRQAAVLIRYLTRSANPHWQQALKEREEPPGNLALALECLAEARNLRVLEDECTDLLRAILEAVSLPGENEGGALSSLLNERILPAAEEIRLPDAVEQWYTGRADRVFRSLKSPWLPYWVARLATVWITRRTLLVERATNDEDEYVRSAALYALARGWADRDDTRTLLTGRATKDEHYFVRSAALDALARGWADRDDTRILLTGRATKDENHVARNVALEALARGWADRDDTRTLITGRATKDENVIVRRAALEALARGWADRDDTRTLITGRATKDENKYVRSAALQALAALVLERGAVVLLSRDLDGDFPFVDPLAPLPEKHLQKGAEKLGISEQQTRELLAACEPALGWNPLTGYQPG